MSTQIHSPRLTRAFREVRADFTAGRVTRFSPRMNGVAVSTGSGSDYHYRDASFLRMIELARHFDRNDVVVRQGITRLIANVLQGGITLDATTGDEAVNDRLNTLWNDWATKPDSVDLAGKRDFHWLAQTVLRSVIVDGDVFLLPLRDGQLQSVEAHRVRTPQGKRKNITHGVEHNDKRKCIAYYITTEDLNPHQLPNTRDMHKIAARDSNGGPLVIHVWDPQRFSQTRGFTLMAPITEAIGIHDELQLSNLVRAQVAACYAVFRELPTNFAGGNLDQWGSRTSETQSDGSTRSAEEIAPGMEIEGRPGEKLSGFAPNVPNPEFFPHAMMILTFIAVNLGIPVAVLLLDPSKTNFSAWRGAMDQARIGFRCMQRWMIDRFYRPVYRWKLQQFLSDDTKLKGLVVAARMSPEDVGKHSWRVPTWAYIEPLKDAQADAFRLDKLLISPRRLQNERGRDWGEVAVEYVLDRGLLVREALKEHAEILKEFSDTDLDWRELAGANFMPLGRTGSGGPRTSQLDGGGRNGR